LYYDFNFFSYNKLSLDLILWDVFNFNILFGWSHLFDDITLYWEKLDLDNIILNRNYTFMVTGKLFFTENTKDQGNDLLYRLNFLFIMSFLMDFTARLLFFSYLTIFYKDLLLDLRKLCFKSFYYRFLLRKLNYIILILWR